MSSVIALIPARTGSKGIPHKNFRYFNDSYRSPVDLALLCAAAVPADEIVLSTDDAHLAIADIPHARVLPRPSALAQDDTPMLAVVEHALAQIPGEPDDVIVLLQPTQPLREPKHVTAAIALLRETHADSVVSVVQLPLTHHPQCVISDLVPSGDDDEPLASRLRDMPSSRQAVRPVYRRDGTVYAFWRQTVTEYGHIYGADARALIIPASESCSLDTMDDWAEAERRLRANQQSEVVVAHV